MANASYQKNNYGYDEEGESLTRRAIRLALAPLRILTSRAAIKVYLATILFLTTSAVLLTVSSSAYAFFYYNYIPQINLERTLYLQYGGAGARAGAGHDHEHPYAIVALDTTALIANQAYDVSLILEMPRCATNLNAGNFMLDLSLLGGDPDDAPHAKPPAGDVSSSSPPPPPLDTSTMIRSDDVLHRSRRPAILPFASPVPALTRTLVYLPFHILGMRDSDRSTLVVPMFEMLVFDRRRSHGGSTGRRMGNVIPTHAKVEVQSRETLRVYSARLVFRAQFQGLRYVVYNYRGVSFVVFSALFYTVAVTSMLLGWGLMAHFWSKLKISTQPDTKRSLLAGEGKKIKREAEDEEPEQRRIKAEDDSGGGVTKIKTEDEDPDSSPHGGLSMSNLSDTPAQYPTRRGRPPLTYSGRLSSGSGSGTRTHAAEVVGGRGGGGGGGGGGDDAEEEEEEEHLRRPMGVDEAADDEDEGDHDQDQGDGRQEDQEIRGRAFDSGIGTSMESEQAGSAGRATVVRRRSSRGTGKR
ncbi:hypothetical protein G647_02794 [Cladophialophora carrionii CBS 160.54]|uniref:Seipin n=1 Tax=Cladophialophora carrionii CBS 160.54 TaxID=1279043 RepID=V9DJA0_9EURO|nr:uncharacterized protein G647_02794 [Cladophialophora carrionii CBS 160.54]ETI26017.1 hypothetical protein G647_02794 [Cladophialophora carrionii CBS 160.54]